MAGEHQLKMKSEMTALLWALPACSKPSGVGRLARRSLLTSAALAQEVGASLGLQL